MVYLARKTIAGKRYFYLVKSLKVEGEVHKIQRYLGSKEPSPHDLTRLEQTHASWFEAKAVERKARVSASKYRSQYLAPDIIEALEQIHFRHLAARRLLSANELIRANQHFKVSHFQNTLSLAGVELKGLPLDTGKKVKKARLPKYLSSSQSARMSVPSSTAMMTMVRKVQFE